MKTWNSNDARSCFAEVMKQALAHEPQRIAGDDRRAVVVLDEAEYRRLVDAGAGSGGVDVHPHERPNLADFMRHSPLADAFRAGELAEDIFDQIREDSRVLTDSPAARSHAGVVGHSAHFMP